MSGAEVIGLISGVISIVTAIKEIYDAVKDKDNIPEAFREVIAKLPLVHDTLEAAKAQIEVEQSAVTGPVENIIRSCQDKAAKLMKLFQKVTPQEDESRTDRYLKAVRRIGKGGRVEVLMRGILQDLQILASNRTMKMNSEAKVQALERAVEEISALKPSVADDEFPEMSNNFSQYGGGNMFNTTGGKNNFNLGEGNTFQGDNQYFGELFKRK
jgi:hypothetical protein